MCTPTEIVLERIEQGFNCSQSVFSAFAPLLGIPDELAMKLASPFGGGIGRTGHVCGAVSGALMVIGVKHGTTTPEGNDKTYKVTREFIRRFEEKHASIICRQLIDCDLGTPEGLQSAREKQVFKTICPVLIKDAAEIVSSLAVQEK